MHSLFLLCFLPFEFHMFILILWFLFEGLLKIASPTTCREENLIPIWLKTHILMASLNVPIVAEDSSISTFYNQLESIVHQLFCFALFVSNLLFDLLLMRWNKKQLFICFSFSFRPMDILKLLQMLISGAGSSSKTINNQKVCQM